MSISSHSNHSPVTNSSNLILMNSSLSIMVSCRANCSAEKLRMNERCVREADGAVNLIVGFRGGDAAVDILLWRISTGTASSTRVWESSSETSILGGVDS